jgi:hypothetical protein
MSSFRLLLKYVRSRENLKYEPKESYDNFSQPGLKKPMQIPAAIAGNFSRNFFWWQG